MSAVSLPRPGPLHGPYPERAQVHHSLAGDLADRLGDLLTRPANAWARRQRCFLAALERCPAAAPGEVATTASVAARRLVREGFTPEAAALGLRAAADAVHAALGLQPYLTQQIAAFALLQGRLVEMDTGEGKSLAILLAAVAAALARVPLHVITSNEYLATRDAEAASRVLGQLGLRAAAVRADMDADQRRAAYACDVTYATAQEIGFDFLRDRRARMTGDAPPVLRGLCFALVDEADSILLDHAQTPLVLAESTPEGPDTALSLAAWSWTRAWRAGQEFHLDPNERRVDLPQLVPALLPPELARLGDARLQASFLREALVARHILQRDVHYLVEGAEVVLLDLNTGRKRPGTVWSPGLQSMVHLKEGLPPPESTTTSMQITLQGLLQRYLRFAGISGTLRESSWALWFFFRLEVSRVEPRLPSRRRQLGRRLYAGAPGQLAAIADAARRHAGEGRAVLVGVASIVDADRVSAALHERGIAHRLLTARDDRGEAAAIAEAGGPGVVTVATNIAGRGTDIALADATRAAGGLHVICCAQNASARIDRQLFGRAARNGLPGSCESILSLDDQELRTALPSLLTSAARRMADKSGVVPSWIACVLPSAAQRLRDWSDLLRTWQLVRQDRLVRDSLTFAPCAE